MGVLGLFYMVSEILVCIVYKHLNVMKNFATIKFFKRWEEYGIIFVWTEYVGRQKYGKNSRHSD